MEFGRDVFGGRKVVRARGETNLSVLDELNENELLVGCDLDPRSSSGRSGDDL